jgi:hypothetical protein
MSAPNDIYDIRRLRMDVTKSTMMTFSKLAVIIIIMDVWIKASFNIPGGSIYAVYKDIFTIFLIVLTGGFVVTNPKRIVRNKIDYFVLLYLVYAAFELIWTFYLSESFIVGVVRFRLYFLLFVLYFYFKFLALTYVDYMSRMLHFIYKVITFIFAFTILEFVLTNFDIVSPITISSFLERGSGTLSPSSYSLGNYGSFHRGLGVLGSILLNGVLCVVGLAMIMFINSGGNRNFSGRLLVFAGVIAVLVSGAKTAWLLLFVIFVMMALFSKSRLIYFSIVLILFVVGYIIIVNVESIRVSTESTIFHAIPAYYYSLTGFLDSASILQILFGGGYSIHEGAFKNYSIDISNANALMVGNEVFFVALLKQFGIIGMLFYVVGFMYIPLLIFINKATDPSVRGVALAVLITGISSIHYNAIFRAGVNILVIFGLAYISYALDRKRNAQKIVSEVKYTDVN